METKTCLSCPNLRGCRRIVDVHGRVQANKVVLPPYTVECPDWGPTPVGGNETGLRSLLLDKFGMAAIQAIHRLATNNLQDEEEEVSEEHVDLGSLLFDGIKKSQREQQLTFLTDEEGNVLTDEDGEKEPRRNLHVRKYAVDVLGLPESQALFWSKRELVRAVIKEEDELGYFSKKKGGPKGAAKSNPQPEKQVTTQPKEKRMPVVSKKSKVVVRRGKTVVAAAGKAKSGAVPSKVAAASKAASPVTSKKRKGAASKAAASKAEAPAEAAASSDITVIRDDIREQMEEMRKYVKTVAEAAVNEVNASVDVLRQEMVTQHTTLHDVFLYRIQLNASKVPVIDEEENQLVDEEGEPLFVPYEVDDPEDGLLQDQGRTIVVYEGGDEETGEA